ncbi:MAG: hypothetical protein C0401_08230 [Anaerolinea sp.]|nr:hypothetical protein [Anaerolinea sp.]
MTRFEAEISTASNLIDRGEIANAYRTIKQLDIELTYVAKTLNDAQIATKNQKTRVFIISAIVVVLLSLVVFLVLRRRKSGETASRSKSNKKVLLCFDKSDLFRASVVRKSLEKKGKEIVGFFNIADFEELEGRRDDSISNWIDKQIDDVSVTAVLVGNETCSNKWIKYTIEKSIKNGNGLLGIDISKIKDAEGNKTNRCGKIPEGYAFYLWFKDEGEENLGTWIEESTQAHPKKVSSRAISDQKANIEAEFPRAVTRFPESRNTHENPRKTTWVRTITGIGILAVAAILLFVVLGNRKNNMEQVLVASSTPDLMQLNTSIAAQTEASVVDQQGDSVPAEVQALADQAFANGAMIYLYDQQPAVVPLSELNSTTFSLRYILSRNASRMTNILLLWKGNAEGTREFIIPENDYLMPQTIMFGEYTFGDWARETGTVTFTTKSRMADTSNQQGTDPNTAVFTTWIITFDGTNPLYARPNQKVENPVYLDVMLVVPEKQGENLLLPDDARQLSNTVRFEITP